MLQLLRIFVTLTRCGAWQNGKNLARALEALGPTYIKLGQMLSTRPDLVGEETAEALGNLRDRVAPFTVAKARQIIETELRRPIPELFQNFSDAPVAAASIAQVHFAVLHDGTPVAVKILRPGIHTRFARDIALFYRLAKWAERLRPRTRRLKLPSVVALFEKTVTHELDLRMEAAAAAELRENLATDATVTVPEIYWNYTSRSVLTMERVEGVPISDTAALRAAGHDLNALVSTLAATFFRQVFRDGFFHADLHPGNIFVQENGAVAMVDFGIMGRVSRKDRMAVAEILHGFLTQDFTRVAEVHFTAGYVPRNQNMQEFAQACRAIAKPILEKPLHEISIGALLGQLFQVTRQFRMETQPQLLLLQKTMVMVEGVGRSLNPDMNMWKMAEPMIKEWASDHFSLRGRAREILNTARAVGHELPTLLRVFTRWAEHGSPV